MKQGRSGAGRWAFGSGSVKGRTNGRIRRRQRERIATSVLFVLVACWSVVAKDQPFQVISWPDADKPVVRFTFSKFKEIGSATGKAHTYMADVTADNLSDKTISGVSLLLYVFDKSKARIGEGYIGLTNVPAGETVKFQVTISASGAPNSLAVEAPEASALAPYPLQ